MKKRFLVNYDVLETEKINLNHYERISIYKAYIPADDVDIFVTKTENNMNCKCFMSIKAKVNPEYRNAEFEIPYSEYRHITGWKLYKDNIIDKIRYEIPLENNLTIYVETYNGQLFDLIIAEIEFEAEKDIELFKKPNWCVEDITNNEKYEDKNLITLNLLKKMGDSFGSDEKMDIDLTNTEFIELMYLQRLKFKYLVRDEIGTVVAFKNKPHIEDDNGLYVYGQRHWIETDSSKTEELKNRKKTILGSYDFLQFENEPMLIKDLTKNYEILKKES